MASLLDSRTFSKSPVSRASIGWCRMPQASAPPHLPIFLTMSHKVEWF